MAVTLIPWSTWTVHRDGGTWSGLAACLYDAIERSRDKLPRNVLLAQERQRRIQRAFELRLPWPSEPVDTRSPEAQHADDTGTWTPHTGDVLDQLSLPGVCSSPWSEAWRVSADEVVRVHASRREAAVAPATVQGIDDVLAWFRQAHARALETGRAFKAAEKLVDFYASGKRRGQVKWPRKITADYRERFVLYREAHATSAAVEEVRTAALSHLRAAVVALGYLGTGMGTRKHPREGAIILRKHMAALDSVDVDDVSREVAEARARLRPHVERVHSVETYGFAPGVEAVLLPATWDDLQEPRRVRVLAVDVDPPLLGTCDLQHRRLVQVLDRKQWQEHEAEGRLRPEVTRLRSP